MSPRDAEPGQRVAMIDSDTNEIVHGTIIEQRSTEIAIKWDDIQSICEHPENEWHLIACVKS